MGKRKRDSSVTSVPQKRRRMKGRKGYSSVSRTRGGAVLGEMKYYDSFLSGYAISASTNWTATEADPTTPLTLFVPTQGAGINQRIGKACKVYKMKIHGMIYNAAQADQTTGKGPSLVRIILFQDYQTNASQAQGEQLMDATLTGTANIVNSFQNIDNFGRFRVLKDIRIRFDNPNLSYDGLNLEQQGIIKPFKFNINFRRPVEVRFNSTAGGTVADLVDNSWHILAVTNGTGLAPTLSYQCRVCFKG